MTHPRYDVITAANRLHYEFISIGRRGQILKIIEYRYLPQLDYWNLGFGDQNPQTGSVDDSVVSDNGDGRKVLATVVMTLLDFFAGYAGETVIFTGSTTLRTSVYKRAILHYNSEFSESLIITGLDTDGNEHPVETGMDYVAFLIRHK